MTKLPADEGQPKRRPGRPPKSAEQRAIEQERRIPPSFQGRLSFRPGDPHALDVQIKAARNYRALITEQISQLQAALSALDAQDDPSMQISQEENALRAFLWETYKEHKHREHILATFLSIRRERQLARLEAARSALELASELLAPDERILRDLRRAIEQAKAHSQERERQEATGSPEPEDNGQEEPPTTTEEAASAVDSRHIYGDARALKEQLAAFDKRVKQMRTAISMGTGWFEEYYIYKTRLTQEARKYIMRGEEPPEGIQLLEEVVYGPYLKYRWRESGIKGAPINTLQMGLIPSDEIASAEHWAAILAQEKPGPPNL